MRPLALQPGGGLVSSMSSPFDDFMALCDASAFGKAAAAAGAVVGPAPTAVAPPLPAVAPALRAPMTPPFPPVASAPRTPPIAPVARARTKPALVPRPPPYPPRLVVTPPPVALGPKPPACPPPAALLQEARTMSTQEALKVWERRTFGEEEDEEEEEADEDDSTAGWDWDDDELENDRGDVVSKRLRTCDSTVATPAASSDASGAARALPPPPPPPCRRPRPPPPPPARRPAPAKLRANGKWANRGGCNWVLGACAFVWGCSGRPQFSVPSRPFEGQTKAAARQHVLDRVKPLHCRNLCSGPVGIQVA